MTTTGCRDNANSKTEGSFIANESHAFFKCFLVQILKSSYLPVSVSFVKKQTERLMRFAFLMKAI